ncbi:cytochrome c oxidase assembly factor 6 [Paragonimus westermani]|uniref:Cytochrome c oxidase assembly factor 6 n=1 Tax=Paragonimus westermani TaxID=34504 RepID=A0A5J4NMQ8_9TREM|nr:cytochrome c oxidase assembly factor 6 [Paragonimus westermani]
MNTKLLKKSGREKCWSSRDAYWNCVTQILSQPENAQLTEPEVRKKCSKERELYVDACPGVWVTLFDQKREFELFKARKFEEDLKSSVTGRRTG